MSPAELAMHHELLVDLNALIWEADPDTFQFTYVSRGAERLLGYSLEHWLARPQFWAEMLHPDDRDAAVALCKAAVAEGRDHEFEYRAITADHRVIWIRDIVRVTRDERGRTTGLRGAMLDVTDRKSAESALEKKDDYFRALIENSQDMIAVLTRDGRVIYESPSARRIMGYDSSQRIGKSAFIDVHPDDQAATRAVFERMFAAGAPTPPVQFRYRHADGAWRTHEAIGQPFLDRHELVGIINSRDITDRITLEEDIRHAQKMEALGRLTGSIAHDFNNLLTTILASAELALGTEYSVGVRPELIEIRKAAELGGALTRQLLMFGLKRPDRRGLVDVPATVRNLEGMLKRLAGGNATLALETYQSEGALADLGEGNLEQILMNLVVNAREAMPWGGTIHLAVTTSSQATAEGSTRDLVTIEVADTGVGMSRHVRARIFEPYFTTKAPDQGTGLGLATVYRIVKDAGGSIEVNTEIGQGARFLVHLPRVSSGTRNGGADLPPSR